MLSVHGTTSNHCRMTRGNHKRSRRSQSPACRTHGRRWQSTGAGGSLVDDAVPVLLLLGVVLVTFGAVMLLRFPDRPGGTIRLQGLEVSSIGAGLPLIVLGAFLAVWAVGHQREHGGPVGRAVPAAMNAVQAPSFCTIRGIPDAGYLNAALTGRSKEVVAVAVWSFDDRHWFFKPTGWDHTIWSAPADPTYLWEIGQPGDPPDTTFEFAMLTRKPRASGSVPAEDDGRRTIPASFRVVGERITVTKGDLLRGGIHRNC